MSFSAILWRDWLMFKSRFISLTLSNIAGPLMYLVAFGWGLGTALDSSSFDYTAFVIPGIIAMNSMTSSFSYVAYDINISRMYGKTFEAIMVSPIRTSTFAYASITASVLRAVYASVLILLVSLFFQRTLPVDPYFFTVLILNCYVFASIGFIAGILIKSHVDIGKVADFVIMPMSFLCGTLFPLDRFPAAVQNIFNFLPLTQAVNGLRDGVHAPNSFLPPLVLCIYLIVLLPIAAQVCKKAE